ncbi:PAS domain-containing sensor histidine kinase [Gemmatirosa kalamazoonensis]|nr:PAS domain-containing sensor histidine kinase [Gemmatirosa kalamazoonensis]
MTESSATPQAEAYDGVRVSDDVRLASVARMLDVVSDVFVLLDDAYRIVYHNEANRAAMRAAGADPDAALGRVVWEVLPMPPGTVAEGEVRRAMRERVPTQWEERYHPDVVLRGRAYPTADGGVVVVAQNVTDARRAADAARAALERGARLQAVTAALSRAATPQDVVRVVIDEGRRALGARGGFASTLVDGDMLDIVDAFDYGDELLRVFRRAPLAAPYPACEAARTGAPVWLASRAERIVRYPALADAEATRRFASWMFLPLTSPDGVLGVLSFTFAEERAFEPEERTFAVALAEQCAQALDRARLLDAERRAREAERAARAAAEEANRAKLDFLRAMSHELRTPLNAIGGYADLLALGVRGALTADQRSDVERILHNQRHLLGIINDILNFARLDAGHLTYDVADVRLRELVEAMEPLIGPQLREKAIAFEVDACGASLVARADAEKVRQILLNLLANAVKFTASGGRVWVACEAASGAVLVSVHDTGVGIPPERLDDVFEPFVQVHRSLAMPTGGTGLGLAISRELARGMGGDLTVRSVPAEGSTFVLRLPGA